MTAQDSRSGADLSDSLPAEPVARLFGASPPGGPVFGLKVVLNIGCGPVGAPRPYDLIPSGAWREIRLDIDPTVEPDILASITDMTVVPDASVDAIWSSHNLEHLFQHEVSLAARECLRVLKPGGRLVVMVPDLASLAAAILEDRLEQPLYMSHAGPITPLDMLYGHGTAIEAGRHFMVHRTGFTQGSLGRVLHAAGFDPVLVRRPTPYDLVAMAFRPPVSPDVLAAYGLPPIPPASDTVSDTTP